MKTSFFKERYFIYLAEAEPPAAEEGEHAEEGEGDEEVAAEEEMSDTLKKGLRAIDSTIPPRPSIRPAIEQPEYSAEQAISEELDTAKAEELDREKARRPMLKTEQERANEEMERIRDRQTTPGRKFAVEMAYHPQFRDTIRNLIVEHWNKMSPEEKAGQNMWDYIHENMSRVADYNAEFGGRLDAVAMGKKKESIPTLEGEEEGTAIAEGTRPAETEPKAVTAATETEPQTELAAAAEAYGVNLEVEPEVAIKQAEETLESIRENIEDSLYNKLAELYPEKTFDINISASTEYPGRIAVSFSNNEIGTYTGNWGRSLNGINQHISNLTTAKIASKIKREGEDATVEDTG
ncbi:hypothetical protein KKF73_05525 [Patescibacteria group bacterium]|nr:hypothetical protein [Patescibacteria group bacterium]